VAEKRLDVADVRAVLVHQGSHRVAEQVTRSTFAQLRILDAAPDHEGQMIGLNGSPGREEHREVVRLGD